MVDTKDLKSFAYSVRVRLPSRAQTKQFNIMSDKKLKRMLQEATKLQTAKVQFQVAAANLFTTSTTSKPKAFRAATPVVGNGAFSNRRKKNNKF